MARQMEALERLQETDIRIDRIKNFIDHYSDFVDELDREFAELKRLADEEKNTLDGLKKERAKLELDLKDGEEHIKRCNVRLYAVKTNKEYEATLKEIGEQKAKNSETETSLLLLYDQVDAEEKKLAEAREKVAREEKQIQVKKKELAQKLERGNARLPQEEKAKLELVAELKPDALELYQWLQSKMGPKVLGRVVNEVCQSCFRKINSQMYNETLGGEHLVQCPGCNRILVHKTEEFLAGEDFEF